MALKINFNYSAAVTQTAVETNNRLMNKSLLRLSTGLRILNAADDSAGLFIADQLAIVAAGLEQGNRNISTAISALQIAENSAGQIFNKLKQIYVKAENAANDINDPNARAALQREIDQLIDAIRKIGTDTEYNGIKLLDGTFSNKYIHYGPRKDQVVSVSIDSVLPKDLGAYMVRGQGSQYTYMGSQSTTLKDLLISGSLTDFILENGEYVDVDGIRVLAWSGTDIMVDAKRLADEINATNALRLKGLEAVAKNDNLASKTFNGFDSLWTPVNNGVVSQIDLYFYVGDVAPSNAQQFTVTLTPSGTPDIVSLVNEINTQASNAGVSLRASIKDGKVYLETGGGETIAVRVSLSASSNLSNGATVDLGQLFENGTQVTFTATNVYAAYVDVGEVDIAGVDSYTIDYSGVSSAGKGFNFDVNATNPAKAYNLNSIDVTTNETAEQALLIIKKAIERVDRIRAEIGATMNNLQAIYDAQKVAWDNTKEAENVIRNTDFTKEMMTFTTMQIRMQSGIAMLAQANTLPQLVLQLLR